MAKEQKFLFDTSFDVEETPGGNSEEEAAEAAEKAEPEVVVPSFSEEEIAAARDDAFAQGKAEGVNEAAEATERDIVTALGNLSAQFQKLFQDHEKSQKSVLDTAISVSVAISRKIFPALNERNGLDEIERMIEMSVGTIIDEPMVTVTVNPGHAAGLEDRLGGMDTKASYTGEIKVVSSEEVLPGDCRVEWSGGGAKRDMTVMWQEIDEIIERNLFVTDNDETPETSVEAGQEKQPEASEPLPEDAPEDAAKTPDGEDAATDPEGP